MHGATMRFTTNKLITLTRITTIERQKERKFVLEDNVICFVQQISLPDARNLRIFGKELTKFLEKISDLNRRVVDTAGTE